MDAEVELTTSQTRPQKSSNSPRNRPHDPEAAALQQRAASAHQIYGRGKKIRSSGIKDKKLRGNLKSLERKYKDATLRAQDAEILHEHEEGFLEPEGELERTYKVTQEAIKENVAVETAKKGFDLKLEGLGPYVCDYTPNGRGLLLAGRKGHVATMDWRGGKLGCELQLQETVRDAKYLHNEQSVLPRCCIPTCWSIRLVGANKPLDISLLLRRSMFLSTSQLSGNFLLFLDSSPLSMTHISGAIFSLALSRSSNSA